MALENAEAIIHAVERVQEREPFISAYNACKAADVSIADYKAARLAVYGTNEAA